MMRRGYKRLIQLGALWLVLGLALAVTDCSDGGTLPDFPEFAPARPFIEEQQERKRRAQAIALYRQRERLKFGILNQEENLASWLPVYRRAEQARLTKPSREETNREAFARFQEQTKARWLPVQTRAYVLRETRPQREQADFDLMRQYQEKTKSEWLPNQTRIFELRESRPQEELRVEVKKRREAKFPSGTRLPGIDGSPLRAP